MGKVMRHTLGASLNIRHNLSSSKGPKHLQLKLLTTYIPKTSAFTLAFSTSQRDRKSGSAGMPRPISYAVFCLKKKKKYNNPHLKKLALMMPIVIAYEYWAPVFESLCALEQITALLY